MDVNPTKSSSWLSLVAETAGVSGATIERVHLMSETKLSGRVQLIVQMRDQWGRVIGATTFQGDASELNSGVHVDLGCDLFASQGCRVIAWFDEGPLVASPREAVPHSTVSEATHQPGRAMKLMLSREDSIAA